MKLGSIFVYAATALVVASFRADFQDIPEAKITNSGTDTLDASIHETSNGLHRRFDSDDASTPAEWAKYTGKGGAMMCGLEGSDKTAGTQMGDKRKPPSAKSIWEGDLRAELHTWYWRETDPSPQSCDFDGYYSFQKPMKALGLSGKKKSDGGDNTCYRIEHWDPENRDKEGHRIQPVNQRYSVAGSDKKWRATRAHYEFGINNKGGALSAIDRVSRRAAARSLWHNGYMDPDPADLPALRSFADVSWSYWNRDNPDLKNIRYFFAIGIANDESNRVIGSCLENAKKELSSWPGTDFTAASEEGHALLGSPNGATFAYFLLQHKADLGQKTISKITIFRDDTDTEVDWVDPSLVFHVVDGKEPPPDEEDKSTPSAVAEFQAFPPRAAPSEEIGAVRVHKIMERLAV